MVSSHSVKSGGDRHYGSEDIIVFVCNVILQEHLSKGLYDFMGRSHLR